MIGRLFGRWFVRQDLKRTIRPEAAAIALAEKKGFIVDRTRVRRDIRLWVDDAPRRVEVRVDLLLTKWGRRYVGLVVTDNEGLDPGQLPKRRQLLEYRVAFGVDGVLIIDLEGKKLKRVEFERPFTVPFWSWIAVGAVAGMAFEAQFRSFVAVMRFLRRFF